MTHHDSSPSTDRHTSAAPVSALSAIGSAILPKLVTSRRRRARSPSTKSVTDAMHEHDAAAAASPPGLAAARTSRSTTNAGTSTSRTTVSTLATFSTPSGASRRGPSGPAAASVTALAPHGDHLGRCQVDAVGPSPPGARPASPPRRQHAAAQQSSDPSTSGRLVRRPALVPRRPPAVLLDEHLDHLADPVRGPLGHELLGQPGEVAPPGGAISCLIELGRQRPPPRCRPRRSSRRRRSRPAAPRTGTLQLGQVGVGLAREADDEVGPDARLRAGLPDLLEQRAEPLAVTEPPHRRAAPARSRAGRTGRSTGRRRAWRSSPRSAPGRTSAGWR